MKLPTIATHKRRGGKSKRREEKRQKKRKSNRESKRKSPESKGKRSEKRREEERKSQMKGGACAQQGSKVAKHCVVPVMCGSGGSKSRLPKAAGAYPSGQMRGEELHAVVARSTSANEKLKHFAFRALFWTWRS